MKNKWQDYLKVFLIRVPIIAPLYFLSWLGEQAHELGQWVDQYLPGLKR